MCAARISRLVGASLVMLGTWGTNGNALERTVVPLEDDGGRSEWRGSSSCVVSYSNTCTGWINLWRGWWPREQVGVILDPCGPDGQLVSTTAYFWTGAPAGWGHTGTLEVSPVVGDCPGEPYEQVPLLPSSGPIT